jgi:LmbE family N-acetylglucosaminyl deacetylase
MFSYSDVLVLAAHPDDIEYGCLGTLLKYRKNMLTLNCYVFTSGGAGDISNGFANRRMESKTALECIHPNSLSIAEDVGMMVDKYPVYVGKIEELVHDYAIDTVLVTSQHDTHQDHRLLYEVVMTALRRTKVSILCYGNPSNTLDSNPRLFVDITEFMPTKLKALRLHKSQESKPYMGTTYLDAFHSDPYALAHGILCVEKFEIERLFL